MERMLARMGTVGAMAWRPLWLASMRAGFYAWRDKGEIARQYSDTKLGSGADLGFRFSVHNVLNLG